jgi:hypothetical protein
MTYGHAERNLALIRQLEAEMRQLDVSSASGHVPLSDQRLPDGDKGAPASAEAVRIAAAPYRKLR